jgi:predicted dehydrogenase
MSRRSFLKQGALAGALVVAGPGMARTYAQNNKLKIAYIATNGRGGGHLGVGKNENVTALCEVELSRVKNAAEMFPQAKVYQDYRKMFDEMHKDIDAVFVATPDHHHAPAASRALALGKACYCEKPLTYSIHEARVLAEMTKKMKVATQMGNQGHANQGNRRIVEWITDGAIGEVKEVHTWTNRPVWPQGYGEMPEKVDVPQDLDWDIWCGPRPRIDRVKDMHPFAWRGWLNYGTGTIGDMGCHTWDSVWWSMAPGHALSCELIKAEGRNNLTHPKQMILKWEFGPTAKRPAFTAFWYDGGLKPDAPEELGDGKLAGSGNLYVGTKGKLLVAGDYGDSPRLIPESFMQAYKQPERMEASPGHHQEFVMAAKGEKPWDYPKSNFTYGGPLVEAMLLGIVALNVGGKVTWDPKKCEVTGNAEANKYVTPEFRKGWELAKA